MKAVMISINPEWVEKIHRGEKIWELRKSVPKPADHQFIKVYNYETKSGGGQGKIVSEWVLKYFRTYFDDIATKDERAVICKNACVTEKQLAEYYQKGREVIYAWQIDDLKIYDKPKELSEFTLPECEKSERACENCKHLEVINTPYAYETNCVKPKKLTKAPQSWCYVEENGGKNVY